MPQTFQSKSGDTPGEVLGCKCIALGAAKIECPDGDLKEATDGICQNPSEIVGVKITALNLSGQGLESFPNCRDLANVNVLNLSNNEISELPSDLMSARFLRVLDVSNNKLTGFPKVLTEGLHILRKLNLSHNAIYALHRPVCYQHLTELRARDCEIADFPFWIIHELHFLEVLDLSLNALFLKVPLTGQHPFHRSCNNFLRINFSNTYMTDRFLPIISHFKQLQYLDISNYSHKFTNSISAFGDNLPLRLKVLKAINIRLVEKVNLTKALVEKVNLSHNSLVIMNEVNVSINIRFLVLSDCYLAALPDNFGDMVRLQYLNLSQNDLDSLPATFANLTELVHLDLYQNCFREFPLEQLLPLKKITCFDMCRNPVDVPQYPLGKDSPSYERLRATLRSALAGNAPRASGRVKLVNPPSECSDGYDQDYSRSEDDYSDGDWEAANTSSSPPSPTVVYRKEDDEEEDWDDLDPSLCIYNDATTSLRMGGLNRTKDFFADTLEEEHFQMQLRLVPARIRDSGLLYYRAPSAVLPHPGFGRSAELEEVVEGQFDDE